MSDAPDEKPAMSGPEKLRSFPKAFAKLGNKINELCAWFAGISPGPGISIKKSKGQTIIGLASTTAKGGAGVEGGVTYVVGNDGKVNFVPKHSTWVTPTVYPYTLKTVNGSQSITLDASGIAVVNGGNVTSISPTTIFQTAGASVNSQFTPGVIQLADGTGGGMSLVFNEGIHVFNSSGKDCYIQYSLLTRNMSIREIDVCESGVAKKMLVLASAPY